MSTLYSYVSCFFGFLGRLFRNVLFQLLSFVVLIGVVSISYGAWTTLNREDATSGKKITSTLMQGIIDNINGLTSVINVKDGKVGIGTTSPSTKLEVASEGSRTITLKHNTGLHTDPLLNQYIGFIDANNTMYGMVGETSFGRQFGIHTHHGYGISFGTYGSNTSESHRGTVYINGTTGNVGIGDGYVLRNPAYTLQVGGTVAATSWTTTSDERLKEKIKPLKNYNIENLKSIEYKWNKKGQEKGGDDKRHLGFIAQQIEKNYPDLVNTDNEGYKSVNYTEIIPILTSELQKQKAIIEKLEKENKSYKTRLDTLEKRMQLLEGAQK